MEDAVEIADPSSLESIESGVKLDALVQSVFQELTESDFELANRISPEKLIEIENELSQKLNQSAIMDDGGSDESANIESHIITSKCSLYITFLTLINRPKKFFL